MSSKQQCYNAIWRIEGSAGDKLEAWTTIAATITRLESRLAAAEKVIEAQDGLLVAYRVGGRSPGKHLDALNKWRPIYDAAKETA